MRDKKLGFGLMRLPLLNPDDPGSIDMELFKKMVDVFISRGFTYFDTAYMYCDFKSEEAFKEAVVKRYPRDAYTITTKLPYLWINSEEDREVIFNEQLKKTGVDFFDYYWLHNVNAESIKVYDKYRCFDFLKEKKDMGLAKHIGFSYHDGPELLDRILTEHPEIEFVQIQLNWFDWNSEWVQSRRNYEVITKHGKPVVVMEPVKGGVLADVPEEIKVQMKEIDSSASVPSWAIRFAASRDNVKIVLSGMSNMEQMMDNTSYMAKFTPLNEEEDSMMLRAAKIMNGETSIQCTGCSYCTVKCPKNIAIPKYFALYNTEKSGLPCYNNQPRSQAINYYFHYIEQYGKASDCIKCGQCEKACPQHLPIRKNLELVAKLFESK